LEQSIIVANIFSAIGAVLLFVGYYEVSVKKREREGLVKSGIGSLIMSVAFYLFDSPAFILLNVIWTGISAYGYWMRKQGPLEASDSSFNHFTVTISLFASFVVPGAFAVALGDSELASWFSIIIMLSSYLVFAMRLLTRQMYVAFSAAANLISLTHLFDISNYSSIAQTIISLGISCYVLVRECQFERKKLEA